MIKMDEAKKEIRFIPDERDEEHPPERSFPLLSGYACPFCHKILAAYFKGWMTKEESEYYQNQKPPYRIGCVPGGHYIKSENHQGADYGRDDNRCSWEEFTRRGIVENLRLFVERHEVSRMLVPPLSEKITSIPGFHVVEDICGRDGEMLLFSEYKLFEELRSRDFDAYWKAKEKMGDYLMEVVRGE